MNEYNVIIANPAGNITAFVLDNNIEKKDYIYVANKLMEITELEIEQVGFVKEPKLGGELRLEMMGGEFCGNATRSFGLYLAMLKGELDDKDVIVEISGCSSTLIVETNVTNKHAKTSMPIHKNIDCISLENGLKLSVIVFEGIVHVIAENEEISDEIYEEVKQIVLKKYNPEAFGLMFLQIDKLWITPAVYVKAMDSLVYEKSCGSGTVATAIYLTRNEKNGIFSYIINQPGGIIEAIIYKDNGKVIKATIGGEVILSDAIKIKL